MDGEAQARQRAAQPAGTERFLDVRTLASGNPRLAEFLAPGMRVLDVGCGTGAITRGIAGAVAPGGSVLGIDLSDGLIARAVDGAGEEPNLRFAVADVTALPREHRDRYDVVTASRLLSWLTDPLAALQAMAAAARPGGRVVVLDYDYTAATWDPPLPPAADRFYAAFLAWRAEARMDNAIAPRLPRLFAEAGLAEVIALDASDVSTRGDDDFPTRAALWPGVAATRCHQLVADGMLTELQRAEAESELWDWAEDLGHRQHLVLSCVAGVKPAN